MQLIVLTDSVISVVLLNDQNVFYRDFYSDRWNSANRFLFLKEQGGKQVVFAPIVVNSSFVAKSVMIVIEFFAHLLIKTNGYGQIRLVCEGCFHSKKAVKERIG